MSIRPAVSPAFESDEPMGLPETMLAIDPEAPGGPEILVPVSRPVPRPGRGEGLVKVAAAVQASAGKKLATFLPALREGEAGAALAQLRADVNAYATRFAMPGFDVGAMVHKTCE